VTQTLSLSKTAAEQPRSRSSDSHRLAAPPLGRRRRLCSEALGGSSLSTRGAPEGLRVSSSCAHAWDPLACNTRVLYAIEHALYAQYGPSRRRQARGHPAGRACFVVRLRLLLQRRPYLPGPGPGSLGRADRPIPSRLLVLGPGHARRGCVSLSLTGSDATGPQAASGSPSAPCPGYEPGSPRVRGLGARLRLRVGLEHSAVQRVRRFCCPRGPGL
jgi:hypothetical protein